MSEAYGSNLRKLLDELNIDEVAYHSAGNNAHFILRALVMSTVRDAKRMKRDGIEGLKLEFTAPLLGLLTETAYSFRSQTQQEKEEE